MITLAEWAVKYPSAMLVVFSSLARTPGLPFLVGQNFRGRTYTMRVPLLTLVNIVVAKSLPGRAELIQSCH